MPTLAAAINKSTTPKPRARRVDPAAAPVPGPMRRKPKPPRRAPAKLQRLWGVWCQPDFGPGYWLDTPCDGIAIFTARAAASACADEHIDECDEGARPRTYGWCEPGVPRSYRFTPRTAEA